MFVTFAEYRGGISNTSRWGGGSDCNYPWDCTASDFLVSITSRCGGGSDTTYLRIYWNPILEVSITSRWGGGSDCKPTSPHGYVENRDLNFWKTFIMLHFYHSYKYSLAYLSRNVNRFPAKKAAWLSLIRIGIDDRGSDSSSSADDGGKYACTHENHLLNVESEKNHQKMNQRSGESSRRGSGFMILLMVSPPFTIYTRETELFKFYHFLSWK